MRGIEKERVDERVGNRSYADGGCASTVGGECQFARLFRVSPVFGPRSTLQSPFHPSFTVCYFGFAPSPFSLARRFSCSLVGALLLRQWPRSASLVSSLSLALSLSLVFEFAWGFPFTLLVFS